MLKQFLSQLPLGIPPKRQKIGITISALLKITQTNRAAEIIDEGLDTQNTADWQQQMLGLQSEAGTNSISLDMIRACIGVSVPTKQPDFTLGGLDCGRNGHWLTKVRYYLPANFRQMKLPEVIEKTIRQIYYASIVDKNSLLNLIGDLDYGIVDNEPDRDWATNFCRNTVFEMADQKPGLKNAIEKGKVVDGGVYSRCWNIRQEKFQKFVLNGFLLTAEDGCTLYRMTSSFSQYLGNLKSDRNFFRYLMAVSQDPSAGRWIRPDNNIDDLFFSLMFCEAAFYIKLRAFKNHRGVGTWVFS